MLTYLGSRRFIGDLSLQDADVLAQWSDRSRDILEFGSGGSTQLLAQSNANSIISVETDPSWIERTRKNLAKIPNARPVKFVDYTNYFDREFDLILVDGVDNLRQQFALDTWQYLRVGGVMMFHDTRRFRDFQNVAWVAQSYFNEICQIDVNARASDGNSSNMTVIHKKINEPYQNWNRVEGKPRWTYGIDDGEDHDLWQQNA